MYPVLFKIGPLDIYSYGFMLALAFFACTLLALREARRRNFPQEGVYDLVLWAAIGGIIGARLIYVFYYWELYSLSPWRVFAIWEGGLVFYGGVIGGAIAVLFVIFFKNLSLKDTADIVGLVLPLGVSIGRIGCFLNGCCYGKPTNLPWAIVFPRLGSIPRHPTQIYESLYALFIFAFLWVLRDRIPRGLSLFFFLFFYSIFRFLNEFLRVNPPFLFGLTGSQVFSVVLFAVSATYILFHFISGRYEGKKEES
jgi:phosphatidylglycerol:prolipoprotein diacylglycerol transferase